MSAAGAGPEAEGMRSALAVALAGRRRRERLICADVLGSQDRPHRPLGIFFTDSEAEAFFTRCQEPYRTATASSRAPPQGLATLVTGV